MESTQSGPYYQEQPNSANEDFKLASGDAQQYADMIQDGDHGSESNGDAFSGLINASGGSHRAATAQMGPYAHAHNSGSYGHTDFADDIAAIEMQTMMQAQRGSAGVEDDPARQASLDANGQSGNENMSAEGRSGPEPKGKVTRACDNCRKKKIKCHGGDPDDPNVHCKPCTNSGVQNCTYLRLPQKRGPNKGYIQDLKEDIERGKRSNDEAGRDHARQIKLMARRIEILEEEVDTLTRHVKRLDALAGEQLPSLPEDEESRRKRARRSHLVSDEDLMILQIDESVACGKYQSTFQIMFPILPINVGNLSLITNGQPAHARSAYFLSISATTATDDQVEMVLKAHAALEAIPAGTLMRLQALLFVVLGVQSAGPQADSAWPSLNDLLHEASKEHNDLGLCNVSPARQQGAFVNAAPNLEYSRVARATSLSLRAILLFHTLGTRTPFDLLAVTSTAPLNNDNPAAIDLPTLTDGTFIPKQTTDFWEVLDPISYLLASPTSASLTPSLRRAKRNLQQDHKILVSGLELLQARSAAASAASTRPQSSPTTTHADLMKRALEIADKVYRQLPSSTEDDPKIEGPITFLYFHPLAVAVQTLLDLQKVGGTEEAVSVLKELGEKASLVPAEKKSGWDTMVDALSFVREGNQHAGAVQWEKALEVGYLNVLMG